jgi:hypothetical protein
MVDAVCLVIVCANDSIALVHYVTDDGEEKRFADAGAIAENIKQYETAWTLTHPEKVPFKEWYPVDPTTIPQDNLDAWRYSPEIGFTMVSNQG